MITERTRKVFTYDAQKKIKDADFLLTDFEPGEHASPGYNSRFLERGPAKFLTTSYSDEKQQLVVAAFCQLLRKESTPWRIEAIQPIPGMLRILLHHHFAWLLDYEGEEACLEDTGAEKLAEAKRIYELFGSYAVELTYAPDESRKSWGEFVFDMEDDSLVTFRVEFDKTIVEAESCTRWPESSRNYTLTWKNQKHKKFYADIESTFSLE